jgi:uncharacterized membrane protein YidH (DUF202 family)
MAVEDFSADSPKAKRLAHKARPWVERLARLGYATKGVVYTVVGVIAALAALRGGGKTADTRGALEEIVQRPYGRVMLIVVAVGLAGYALWRLTQAVFDTEDKGAEWKGLAVRAGYACIGFVYFGLGYSAVRLILGGDAGDSSDEKSKAWSATFMSLPFGRLLVGLGGLGFVGFGLWQCHKAFKRKFKKKLKRGEMGEGADTFITRAGQFGLASRGVVFGVVGVFLAQAALRARPHEARGLGGALHALEEQSYGPWILGVVALGLVAYGLLMFSLALYRRIDV